MATFIELKGDVRLLAVVRSDYFAAPATCGVRPVQDDLPGLCLVTSIVQPEAADEMLRHELSIRGLDTSGLDPWILQTPITGGYILACNGTRRVLPGCCADLGDIDCWKVAAEYRGAAWEEIWIGHPTISVRYEEGNLIISEQHEPDDPAEQLYPGKYSLRPALLAQAIQVATEELQALARLLSIILRKYADEDVAQQIAHNLAGLG